ncbi:Phosphatidylinositol transfer protein sfh5 [Penicillium taxi]|uniref:Phosphatidylinositol transfer protein sfh5 n=1 Tax=Penicillium taxi TaxID=168475 RepID=UPI0025454C32|nr:Phosphatidylinositol transfer protein sfh5 [Penicillium taxi]KAJ5894569.1 Phosphatidylinositol transfer protein sfh5 [Penicillium taxi]
MSEQTPVAQPPVAELEKKEVVAVAEPETSTVVVTENGKYVEPTEEAKVDAPVTEEATKEDALIKADEPAQDAPAVATAAAAAAAPEAEIEAAKTEEQKPEYLTKIPSLSQFFDHLPKILASTGHSEMWGVPLKDSEDIPTANVLIKFLRANEGNLQAAQDQLHKALVWRKQTKPLELVESGRFSATKYGGLGYLTTYEQDGRPLVFTWNVYGAVKDISSTFADSDEFVKWRAALMELAVQDLGMKDATTVIDYDGEKDPYQMIQVHDYMNVKFLRMDSKVRAASKQTIEVFSTAYPELLSQKYFVNVPTIMGWMYTAMKLVLSKNTTRKFHPITNGANLAREFPAALADSIPKNYGGKGPELKDGARTVQLEEFEEETVNEETVKEETAKEETAKEETTKEETAKEETAKEETAEEKPAKEEPASEEQPKEEAVKEEAAKEDHKEEAQPEPTKGETQEELKEELKEDSK